MRIIIGTAGAGKTSLCFEEINKSLKNNRDQRLEKSLIYIVPDQISLSSELGAIEYFGALGLNGIEVFSFRWYYERLKETEGGGSKGSISEVGRALIIDKILRKNSEKLNILKSASEKKGFISSVERSFRELKRYDIKSESFYNALKDGYENGSVEERTLELAKLYEEYEKYMSGGIIDDDDNLSRLAEYIENFENKKGFNKPSFWLDGFKDFTPQELKVIESMEKVGCDVTVTLCTDFVCDWDKIPPEDTFVASKKTFCRLEKISDKYGKKTEIIKLESGTKKYLKNIEIHEAKEIWDELDWLARRITSLVRDKNHRFFEIAVVTGDLENYSRFLENVFILYEIPVFVDLKKKIVAHPILSLISGLFKIYESDWSYDSVFKYLKSGFIAGESENYEITISELDAFENFCLRFGLSGKYFSVDKLWDKGLQRSLYNNKIAEAELAEMSRIRETVITPIMKLFGSSTGKKKCGQLGIGFFDYIDEIKLSAKMVEESNHLLNKGEVDSAELQEKIWTSFIEIINEMVLVSGEDLISFEHFGELLMLGLDQMSPGMAPATVDQIIVGDLDRSRHHKIKSLFILGTNEGVFPTAINDSGLINDREREFLESKGCRLAPDSTSGTFEKEFLIYQCLNAPAENLFLSYSVGNLNGEGKRPAKLINELRTERPDIRFSSGIYEKEADIDLIASPQATLSKIAEGIRKKERSREIELSREWFVLSEKYRSFLEGLEKASEYRTNSMGIEGDTLKIMTGGDHITSISKLELYTKCPFSWFVKSALNARDREVFKINLVDVGNILHEIIYITMSEVIKMGKEPGEIPDDEIIKIAEKISDNMSAEGILDSKPRYKYLAERIKKVAKRASKMINKHFRSSKFKNVGNELSFGTGTKLGEAALRLSDGTSLKIRGRIDRLDVYEKDGYKYARIVDYKTGNKEIKFSNIYYGTELQLFGYMDCITNNKQLKPAAALYFKLDEPVLNLNSTTDAETVEKEIIKKQKMFGFVVNDENILMALDENFDNTNESTMSTSEKKGRLASEDFDKVCDYVKNKMVDEAEKIKSGDITARPILTDKEVGCSYCDYISICKFDTSINGNEYNYLKKISEEDALNYIKEASEIWEKEGGKGEL